MTNFLAGFVDELVKLSAAEASTAERQGTGMSAPNIKLPQPGKPPTEPRSIDAPKFGAPPGLKPPRLPRANMALPKLPSTKPRMPNWQRPSQSS